MNTDIGIEFNTAVNQLIEGFHFVSRKICGRWVAAIFLSLPDYSDQSVTLLKITEIFFYPVHHTMVSFMKRVRRKMTSFGDNLVAYLHVSFEQSQSAWGDNI